MAQKFKCCQVCMSSKIIVLNNSVYCEKCAVYYQIENDSQFISAIPVSEIDYAAPELCTKCEKLRESNRKIKCTSFNDFYKKIRLCKECKKNNHAFLKNLYFRNFILCKKTKYVYGTVYRIMYVLALLFALTNQSAVNNFFAKYVNSMFDTLKERDLSKIQEKIVGIFQNIFNKIVAVENKITKGNNTFMHSFLHKMYTNPLYRFLYTHVFKYFINNKYINTVIYGMVQMRIKLKNSMLVGKNKAIQKIKETSDLIEKGTKHAYTKKLIAYVCMALFSFSSRHLMYVWYTWLKMYEVNIFTSLLIAFFAFNKFVIVDFYIYISGFSHIFSSRQNYYEISEN